MLHQNANNEAHKTRALCRFLAAVKQTLSGPQTSQKRDRRPCFLTRTPATTDPLVTVRPLISVPVNRLAMSHGESAANFTEAISQRNKQSALGHKQNNDTQRTMHHARTISSCRRTCAHLHMRCSASSVGAQSMRFKTNNEQRPNRIKHKIKTERIKTI